MSLLLEITKQIETATRRVQSLERALADNPGYPSIAGNLESAVRIQRQLESQFEEAASQLGVDKRVNEYNERKERRKRTRKKSDKRS